MPIRHSQDAELRWERLLLTWRDKYSNLPEKNFSILSTRYRRASSTPYRTEHIRGNQQANPVTCR